MYEIPLKLCKCSEDMEDQLPVARRCVNVLFDAAKPDASLLKLSNGLDEMLERTTKAIQPPDNQHIARANKVQGFLQPCPIGLCVACGVGEDMLAANFSASILSCWRSSVWSRVETRA